MTDNNKDLAAQLEEMAIQDSIDTQVAIRKIMLATALLLRTTDPAIIEKMREDVEMLKKRDWVNLGIAALLTALTGIAAWFKK